MWLTWVRSRAASTHTGGQNMRHQREQNRSHTSASSQQLEAAHFWLVSRLGSLLLPRTSTHRATPATEEEEGGRGDGQGIGVPSLAVWFAEWVMPVSRAICTHAKAPVTFARARAAIKTTGGSTARKRPQSQLSQATAINTATSHPGSPPTHREDEKPHLAMTDPVLYTSHSRNQN